MHDTVGRVEVGPAGPPARGKAGGPARFLLAAGSFLRHRPRRVLGVAAVAVLVALAIGIGAPLLQAEYHLRAARLAVRRGHNGPAIRHLLSHRRFRPNHPEGLLLSARVARRSGAWGEAEALLDRYWELSGDDEALVLERQLLQATQGGVEATGRLLQVHIDRDDEAAALAREALVAGLLYRFRIAEAETQIDRWLEHDPDSTQALLARGKLEEQRDGPVKALRAYRRLVELDPEHDEARMRLTTLLLQQSQAEEAFPHLEYLRGRLPDNPELLVQWAQALQLRGRGDEARAALDECLRGHPDHAAALLERGRMARLEGAGAFAEECLHRAVRLDPGSVTARYQYFLVLKSNGKDAEATREEQAIHRIDDDVRRVKELLQSRGQGGRDDPSAYHEVAVIALRAGRPREAIRWLQNGLRADPDHAPSHLMLARLYHDMGNPILSSRHRAIAERLGNQRLP